MSQFYESKSSYAARVVSTALLAGLAVYGMATGAESLESPPAANRADPANCAHALHTDPLLWGLVRLDNTIAAHESSPGVPRTPHRGFHSDAGGYEVNDQLMYAKACVAGEVSVTTPTGYRFVLQRDLRGNDALVVTYGSGATPHAYSDTPLLQKHGYEAISDSNFRHLEVDAYRALQAALDQTPPVSPAHSHS